MLARICAQVELLGVHFQNWKKHWRRSEYKLYRQAGGPRSQWPAVGSVGGPWNALYGVQSSGSRMRRTGLFRASSTAGHRRASTWHLSIA